MRRAFEILRVCVVGASLTGAGCFSFTPAKEGRGGLGLPAQELPWPEADTAALETMRVATPEKIFRVKPMPGRTAEDITDEAVRGLATTPRFIVTRNEMIDGMLVRMVRTPDDSFSFSALLMGFVPNGYALSSRDVVPARLRLVRKRSERGRVQLNSMWNPHGAEADPTEDEVIIEDGVPFRVPEKVPPNCRGVILHLWALASNEYERRVASELESHGWLVVDIKPGTGALPPLREDAVDSILELEAEQVEVAAKLPRANRGESQASYRKRLEESESYKRQREISIRITDLRNPAIPLCSEADVGGAAEQLGRRVDAALAVNARAVRAALETALREHPTLRGLPVVMVGFSAGAISTPTSAALVKPDAAVIIGGAANAVGIAMRSEISRGGLRLSCDGKPPPPEAIRKLEAAFIEASRLDAYHAAPLLSGIPVLVVDAGMDTWVPSEFGQLLYERLGRPDRLHMALGGHGMLFYFLPGQARRIADWIDRAVGGHAVSDRNIR